MKVFLCFLVSFFLSNVSYAGLNLGQVNGQLELKNEYIPPLSEQDQRWRDFNPTAHTPPITVPKKNYWRRTIPNNSTISTGKHENDWICSVGGAGGTYHRGLKGIDVNVFPSGGIWHARAYHNSGGSENWGSVLCWER